MASHTPPSRLFRSKSAAAAAASAVAGGHLLSPIKPSPISLSPSPSKPAPSAEIPTPEKPVQLPRRGSRNRAVTRSLKEVKRVALRLQTPTQDPARSSGDADDLVSLEQRLVPAPAPKTKLKPPTRLPEKYEMLVEFFNCLESSIRLLRLKGSMSTFPNLCTSIQHLTERKFTYGHLAQLKYVLPEAVLINKVMLRDEATCCMKPELQVSLLVDAVGEELMRKGESGYSALRRIFRQRLVDFSNKHPEGDDVPEEMLPHPFNQTEATLTPKTGLPIVSMSHEPLPNALSPQQFAVPSHMPGSFRRRFSQRTTPDAPKTPLACLSESEAASKDDHPILAVPFVKCTSSPCKTNKSPLGLPIPLSSPSPRKIKKTDNPSDVLSILEGTPCKLVSTPTRLMASTPEIQTPKRSRPTIGYDSPTIGHDSPTVNNESPRQMRSDKRSTRTKLFTTPKKSTRTKLFTTPKKNEKREDEENEVACSSFDDDVLSLLPKSLLQSIKEKERKSLEDREAGVDEANKRQKLLLCLPSMFDVILLIFQSAQRSVMTKQELIHKIITSHTKIVDKGEVEEQLKLLQELIPDCLSERLASSGDTLFCVNKMVSTQEVRQRLAEAD